jgi:hypothetical protein
MLIITKPGAYSPGALCAVTGQTAKRYTVRVVLAGTDYGSAANVQGCYGGKTPYVNKEDVFRENVTEAQYAAYLSAYNERGEKTQAAVSAAYAEFYAKLDEIFGEGNKPNAANF